MTETPRCRCGCGEMPSYNPKRSAYNLYVDQRHRDRYKEQQSKLVRQARLDRLAAQPAPPCACGCGQPCGRTRNTATGYMRYADATCRRRADDVRKKAALQKPVRHCACGCGARVFFQRRYVPGHQRLPVDYRHHPAREMARVPGDLTSAQIERIIAHHKQVLRYERNRQS